MQTNCKRRQAWHFRFVGSVVLFSESQPCFAQTEFDIRTTVSLQSALEHYYTYVHLKKSIHDRATELSLNVRNHAVLEFIYFNS